MGGVLSVEIIVLTAPAAVLLVRGCDLENRKPGLLHEAQQPGSVAAGRLDSDALQLAEGSHPGEHLAIALPGSDEGVRAENPILLIHDRRDV
jgi:hypothetical protein